MAGSPEHEEQSLESRIGSQWFNRIGILAVLIAAAWFLKLAIDNHWIGPLGRVLIGLVAGAGLIAWSERFRTRGYAAFSYSLKAVGSGVLYLSLWAAFSLYHLVDSSVAFAAMIAVTAFNGFLAWKQDAELLALYAIVGGFSTPLLLSTGENHEVALFTYLLLLDAAVLLLVALKPWSRLLCAAFAGTVFFFAEWSFQYYDSSEFGTTTFFLGVFFLIFAWAPRLVRKRAEGGEPHAGWDGSGAGGGAAGQRGPWVSRVLPDAGECGQWRCNAVGSRGIRRVLFIAVAIPGAGGDSRERGRNVDAAPDDCSGVSDHRDPAEDARALADDRLARRGRRAGVAGAARGIETAGASWRCCAWRWGSPRW